MPRARSLSVNSLNASSRGSDYGELGLSIFKLVAEFYLVGKADGLRVFGWEP